MHDVGRTEAADDQPGMPVDCRVPDPARTVIVGIGGPDQASSQSRCKLVDEVGADPSAAAALKLRGCHVSLFGPPAINGSAAEGGSITLGGGFVSPNPAVRRLDH